MDAPVICLEERSMFLIIVLFVAGLAGLAYGWIVVRTSAERVTISIEVAKITLGIRKVKEVAIAAMHGSNHDRERHGQHS